MYYTSPRYFDFYKKMAESMFQYCLPRITRFANHLKLEVDYLDGVSGTFGNFRKPDKIFIHIENVVSEVKNANRVNEVCSVLLTVITHELFHVEQAISQEHYRHSSVYKYYMENSVNAMVCEWLYAHKPEIDQLFGMNLDLSYVEKILGEGLEDDYNIEWTNFYKHMTIDDYYKYTLMNVVFRKDNFYKEFETDVLDKYKNVVISIDNSHNLLIKSDGKFCDDAATLSRFTELVAATAGKYDRYTVNINAIDEVPYRGIGDTDTVFVTFTLSDRACYPMYFEHSHES